MIKYQRTVKTRPFCIDLKTWHGKVMNTHTFVAERKSLGKIYERQS
jgi:hypothetical protein